MSRIRHTVSIGLIVLSAVGCGTTRGVHTVPVSRDYSRLEKVDLADVEAAVERARRAGSPHGAPYEYYVAARYLAVARSEAGQGDRRGAWDFGALALTNAEKALPAGAPHSDEPVTVPAGESDVRAQFDDLKSQFLALDRDQAAQVAPVLYGQAEVALSQAEHELLQGNRWKRAARLLRFLPADIATIRTQDTDGDGVPDMDDRAPWEPEDADGFRDEDGLPDPDNDQDGIPDVCDAAPNDSETRNRWHDHDGAPDEYPRLEVIRFRHGNEALSADSQGYLRGIAESLKEWPELKLHVAGRAGIDEDEPRALAVAQQCAERVHGYLVESAACRPEQLVVTFRGEPAHTEEQPAADQPGPCVELRFE